MAEAKVNAMNEETARLHRVAIDVLSKIDRVTLDLHGRMSERDFHQLAHALGAAGRCVVFTDRNDVWDLFALMPESEGYVRDDLEQAVRLRFPKDLRSGAEPLLDVMPAAVLRA